MSGAPGLPEERPYDVAHRIAIAEATAKLRVADLGSLAERTGAVPEGRSVRIRYFGDDYTVSLDDGAFDPETRLQTRVLILHYLVSDRPLPQAGEHVPFKALPDGTFYDGPYRKRSVERILRAFGDSPAALVESGVRIGGERADQGDASVRLKLFPRIDAYVVLHAADDEFPAEASILYSSTIAALLSLEDVAVLGGDIATRLCRAAG